MLVIVGLGLRGEVGFARLLVRVRQEIGEIEGHIIQLYAIRQAVMGHEIGVKL